MKDSTAYWLGGGLLVFAYLVTTLVVAKVIETLQGCL